MISKIDSSYRSIGGGYSGVDISKFVGCLLVIAIHTPLFKETHGFWIDKALFRLAVPYFFIASGFFLQKKIDENDVYNVKGIVTTYIKRLLSKYVVFELLYIVLRCVQLFYAGQSFSTIIVPVMQHIVFCPYGPAWYLWASIIAVGLLYPFIKSGKLTIPLFVGVLLYFFALLCNSYYGIIPECGVVRDLVDNYLSFCITARNGLFTGFLFIALGMHCFKIKNHLTKKKLVVLCFILYLFYLNEIFLVKQIGNYTDDCSLFCSHIVLLPLLFLLTTKMTIPVKTGKCIMFRNLSTGMYLLHWIVIWFYDRGYAMLVRLKISDTLIGMLKLNVIKYIVIVVVCVSICLLVYNKKLKPWYKLLK